MDQKLVEMTSSKDKANACLQILLLVPVVLCQNVAQDEFTAMHYLAKWTKVEKI
jgi:hypothetical protein